jgi:putative aldouronate transport system substrate-binding protein
MKTRLLPLFLVLVMIATVLPAAGLAQSSVPTLTVLMAQDTYVEDYETNAFTKFIEDSMGVNLDFILLPAAEAQDKLAVMVNSGQKLPDIINIPLDTTTAYRYAQTGAIIPLNDLYDKFGNNTKKVFAENPELAEYIRCPDGNLYSIPFYEVSIHNEVRYKIWLNTVWLDKLGLAMPATTDELYTVLKAFKEKDPNGNGKQDEYPLVGGKGWSQDPTVYLMNSFIQDDDLDHFIVNDGKLDVVYNKDAWKEGLKYIRSLVDEKLLDPISFTRTIPSFAPWPTMRATASPVPLPSPPLRFCPWLPARMCRNSTSCLP